MLSYSLKCRKKNRKQISKSYKEKNGRIILLSKCAMCNSEKLKFVKEQEASRLLNSLEIKTPLNKIPLLGSLLFYKCSS